MVTDLLFTNVGSSTCTLDGFPGVSFLDVGGKQIGAAASRNRQPAKLITLRPHETAASALQVAEAANYPAASCRPRTAVALRVYPPGTRVAVILQSRARTQVCTTASQGSGGQQAHVAPVRQGGR
jgi:hypothetical protein